MFKTIHSGSSSRNSFSFYNSTNSFNVWSVLHFCSLVMKKNGRERDGKIETQSVSLPIRKSDFLFCSNVVFLSLSSSLTLFASPSPQNCPKSFLFHPFPLFMLMDYILRWMKRWEKQRAVNRQFDSNHMNTNISFFLSLSFIFNVDTSSILILFSISLPHKFYGDVFHHRLGTFGNDISSGNQIENRFPHPLGNHCVIPRIPTKNKTSKCMLKRVIFDKYAQNSSFRKSNMKFDTVQDVTGMTSIPASVADYGTTTIDNKQYIYTIGPNDTIPPTFNTTGTLRSLQALNSIPNNVGVGPYHHPHQHQLNYNYSPSHQHHNQINLNHYSTSSHHQVHVNYDEAPATTHIDVDSGRQTKMSYIGHNGHVVTWAFNAGIR